MKSRHELVHLKIFLKPYHRYLILFFVYLYMIVYTGTKMDNVKEKGWLTAEWNMLRYVINCGKKKWLNVRKY